MNGFFKQERPDYDKQASIAIKPFEALLTLHIEIFNARNSPEKQYNHYIKNLDKLIPDKVSRTTIKTLLNNYLNDPSDANLTTILNTGNTPKLFYAPEPSSFETFIDNTCTIS